MNVVPIKPQMRWSTAQLGLWLMRLGSMMVGGSAMGDEAFQAWVHEIDAGPESHSR